MHKQEHSGLIFHDKPVYDWHRFPVGAVADVRRDPKTQAARHLVITLTKEAKTHMGTTEDLLEIPVSFVFGIRKDAVSLDRSVAELKSRDLPRVAEVVAPQ